MKNLIERIKYGKIVNNYNLGSYHVAGPVDGTGKAIGAKYDLSGLVNPAFIQKDGQIWSSDFKKREDYIEFIRKFGQAYLDGRFDFKGKVVPVDSVNFILPIDRNKLNKLISTLKSLRDIEFFGEIKHPISRGTLEDFCLYLMESEIHGEEKTKTKFEIPKKEQSTLEKAEQYLKDLMFWKLNCHDYSDYVGINVQEREKRNRNRLRTNFIINRNWSKANKGSFFYRVIEEDEEKIIISGYQDKEK